MPDDWETASGLDPNNAEDRNDTNLSIDGYTNLEMYINSLVTDIMSCKAAVSTDEKKGYTGSGIVEADSNDIIVTIKDDSITADGVAMIRVFNASGRQIKKGKSPLSIGKLQTGNYVAVVYFNGGKKAVKFTKSSH